MKAHCLLLPLTCVSACERDHQFRKHGRHLRKRVVQHSFPPDLNTNEQILASSFESTSLCTWSEYYSHKRAVAGEEDIFARWTAEQWAKYGFDTRIDSYNVYLNYPLHRSIELKYLNGTAYRPTLEEEVLETDKTTGRPDRVPAFHGYSFSGNATAEYIYVGRGQQEDFKRLQSLGVLLAGKIALAKYGGPFRGLKVKNAQENGMIGVITFTDPGDDKNMTAANGYVTYPDGPARNPTSIQRGSVAFLSTYPGDPTTPGYPSKEDSPRMEKMTVPSIPSLPISWKEAQPLLQALDGHGTAADVVDRQNWMGAIPGVAYATGPAPGVTISLSNIMDDGFKWIHNAIGVINGTNENEVVVVGNHHDAWMIGGAADPHSGSAILIALANALNKLSATGWKPQRTIVLASWDAEEYGLVGSTEWVEEFVPWLKESAIAYLNIDVGISGSIPDFSATPDLHSLITKIAGKIIWPHGANRTLYDVWEEKTGEIGALGAQSDYTAFVHRAGVASMDMGTTRAPADAIYHTHSNFDSFHWMTKFVDPGFEMHKAMGQFLTLMLYHLVDDPVVPLEPARYGIEMRAYLKDLEDTIVAKHASSIVDLSELENAIADFVNAADHFDRVRKQALKSETSLRDTVNRAARMFSRAFIAHGGLPDREFYQHLIFAPGIDTGYAPVTFPGITEQVEAGNFRLATKFVGLTARSLAAAGEIIAMT